MRDHDNLTGQKKFSAHDRCNLNYFINPIAKKIHCVIHNFKGGNAQFILSDVKACHGTISWIPNSLKRYNKNQFANYRFISKDKEHDM